MTTPGNWELRQALAEPMEGVCPTCFTEVYRYTYESDAL